MRDGAETSGDDVERLLQALDERAETYGGVVAELSRDWRARVSDQLRVTEESGTKIIQAVRELLSAFPLRENPGQDDTTGPGDQRTQPITTDLIQNPTGLAQYQSLAMLAALIRWFSRESGRTEAELLEELAANYRR
jgi:hypothetical protein